MLLAVLGMYLFTFLYKQWVPSPSFWIQTLLNCSISSNYADPPNESFWGGVGVEIQRFGPEPLPLPRLQRKTGGFASQTGRGKPLLACDTTLRFCVM